MAGLPISAGELALQEARFPREGSRRQVLDLLIARELLRAEGRARHLHRLPEIAADLAQVEEKLLRQEIEAREGLDQRGPPSEETLAALYREWGSGEEVRPRQILVETQAQAQELLDHLNEGAPFAELAKAYSLHKLSGLGGGDMGFLRREMLLAEFREEVWALGAGQRSSRPIPSRLGYHLIEVQERRTRTLEELRPTLAAELGRRGQEEARKELGGRLREAYHFEWFAEAAQSLLGRARAQATAADSALVVARWEGGQLSGASFLKRVRAYGLRQTLADSALARQRGEEMVLEDLLLAEARRRQYDQAPDLRRRLAAREAELLAEKLFNLEAWAGEATGDSALRVFYEARPGQYRVPPDAQVQEILVEDRASADSLKALILAGADMGQLARAHTARTWAREKEGMLGVLSRDSAGYGPLPSLALEAPVGPLQGPVEVGGEYSIFRVVGRTPDRQASFAEARDLVKKQVLDLEMDRFIAGLRHKYAGQIEIDEQALEAMPPAGR